jgi:hypothetical protein
MKCLELASELETMVVTGAETVVPGAIIGGIKGHAL